MVPTLLFFALTHLQNFEHRRPREPTGKLNLTTGMKTLFIKVALLAAAVLGPLGAAARSLKVHVENPGTLYAFFSEHDMEGVTALTLVGKIN